MNRCTTLALAEQQRRGYNQQMLQMMPQQTPMQAVPPHNHQHMMQYPAHMPPPPQAPGAPQPGIPVQNEPQNTNTQQVKSV